MLFRFSDQFSLIKLVKNQFEIKIQISSIFFRKPNHWLFDISKKIFFFCRRKNCSKSQALINFCFFVVNLKFLKGIIKMDFVVNSKNENFELFLCSSIKIYEIAIKYSLFDEMLMINEQLRYYLVQNKNLLWNFAFRKFAIFLRVIFFRRKIKMLSIFPYLRKHRFSSIIV